MCVSGNCGITPKQLWQTENILCIEFESKFTRRSESTRISLSCNTRVIKLPLKIYWQKRDSMFTDVCCLLIAVKQKETRQCLIQFSCGCYLCFFEEKKRQLNDDKTCSSQTAKKSGHMSPRP